MFKPRLNKRLKAIVIELRLLMEDLEEGITMEKLAFIDDLKKVYRVKTFDYQRFTVETMRETLKSLSEKELFAVLAHGILSASDKEEMTGKERRVLQAFFDLISLEYALKMQALIDQHSGHPFDVKSLYIKEVEPQTVLDESVAMLEEFEDKTVDDVDESLLMKMNKGPIKKVWNHVLTLWQTVNNPKTDKTIKALSIGALIYLISPLDVIPDVIPILGLTDDASLIVYAMTQIHKLKGIKGGTHDKKDT